MKPCHLLIILFLAGGFSNQTFAIGVMPDRPIAFWRMEDAGGATIADSAKTHSGTTSGSPPAANGKIGTGMSFDGSTQYVSTPDVSDLRIGGRITLAAWVKLAAWPGDWGYIVSKGYDGTNEAYFLRISTSKSLEVGSYNSVTSFGTNFSVAGWNLGDWHHVAGVYDGTNWLLYVDGVQVASTAGASGALNSTLPVMIGAMRNGGSTSRFFNGTIDEVGIWSQAKSAAKIREIMAGFGQR